MKQALAHDATAVAGYPEPRAGALATEPEVLVDRTGRFAVPVRNVPARRYETVKLFEIALGRFRYRHVRFERGPRLDDLSEPSRHA